MWFEEIEKENLLVYDDNLEALGQMPSEAVDLIYLDPPFFSGQVYNIIWGDSGEVRSFSDRWARGSEKTAMEKFLEGMEERVQEMHRVLKETGSFYLHCDWHAGHYLKVMCDGIFGYNNFRNSVIWHYPSMSAAKKDFPRKHDEILRYTKSDVFVFNADAVRVPYEESTLGRLSRDGLLKDGYFKGRKGPGALNENGKIADSVWRIPHISSQRERVGYPTQKPIALIERIIKASSNEGDIVLDPFCGGGTTCIAAEQLGRRWIGIDQSAAAIRVTEGRIEKLHGVVLDTTLDGGKEKYQTGELFSQFRPLTILNLPYDYDYLYNKKDSNDGDCMPHKEFELLMVDRFGGVGNPRERGGEDGVKGDTLIEVKQQEDVGVGAINQLVGNMIDKGKTQGVVIAFSFTTGAENRCSKLRRQKNSLDIKLVRVRKLVRYNRRPKVEIYEEKFDAEAFMMTVCARATDPDGDAITVWNWYVNGKQQVTDVVHQRPGKEKNPGVSEFTFKYSRPVKVRATATDDFVLTGSSATKKIGLSNAYRSPSVARVD